MEKLFLYVVLTRTNTMISRIMQLIKKDEYTHAAISLDKELDYMYSFGRKYTYYPFMGRFKQEDINKGLYKIHRSIPIVIIEIEVSKQQYEKAKSLLDNFISNSGQYKYNYRGLLYSLLNKPVCYRNRFLCSEFVYYILKESGITDLKISRNLVRPQSLLNVKGRIIYQGSIKNLQYINSYRKSKEMAFHKMNAI